MTKQKKSGLILLIFGVLVILYSIKIPTYILYIRGAFWRLSLFVMGCIFILIGLINLFFSKK